MAPKDACEVADKMIIRMELTIRECARPVENATLGENIAVGKLPLYMDGKATNRKEGLTTHQ